MSELSDQTSQQTREREHFDRLAESTGEIWWGSKTFAGWRRLQRRASLAKKALSSLADPLVLELGSGTGAFLRPLLELMPSLRLTAVDISPKSIEIAKKNFAAYPRVNFEVMDVSQLAFPAATFDAVIGNSVLHHVPLELTLNESFRVLKPGGIFWFFEPNMMNPQNALERKVRFIGKFMQNSEDETAFFRWSFSRMLKNVGFVDVGVEPFDFLHPGIPRPLVGASEFFGEILEKLPIIREISGSLLVSARKPQ